MIGHFSNNQLIGNRFANYWFHWFSNWKLFFRFEMSSNRDFKTICKKYFTPMENDIFKCKCGKILKQKKGTGWSNLMVHIRTQHETTPSGPQNTLDFMQCKKSLISSANFHRRMTSRETFWRKRRKIPNRWNTFPAHSFCRHLIIWNGFLAQLVSLRMTTENQLCRWI